LFHAGSALGVCPSEPSSSRTAVRCLQRRCPPDVAASLDTTRQPTSSTRRRNTARPPPTPIWEVPRSTPRLQGFDPYESPPLRANGLGRPEHVALLGFLPFRVFPLTGLTTAFTASPLMRLPLRPTNRPDEPSTGSCYPARLACLSRDCRPSWGSSPFDFPRKFELAAVRESPPRAPGCVTVPSSSPL
jgi:hypothetical protein